jgi:hypothetical protein
MSPEYDRQEGRTKYGYDVQVVDYLRKYKYVNLILEN